MHRDVVMLELVQAVLVPVNGDCNTRAYKGRHVHF